MWVLFDRLGLYTMSHAFSFLTGFCAVYLLFGILTDRPFSLGFGLAGLIATVLHVVEQNQTSRE